MKKTNHNYNDRQTNDLTELVFILDRSGSMSGLEEDTVGGFNAMLEKQRRVDGRCLVSTVLFDSRTQVIHDRLPLREVRSMTRGDFTVGGSTALLDALGGAIRHISTIHRYARREDVPSQTVFVIMTDGMENASHSFSADEVRAMIRRQKEQYGWEFLFLAANIDAVTTAARYGIGADRAVNYFHDRQGTRVVYDTVGETVANARFSREIDPEWAAPIQADMKIKR